MSSYYYYFLVLLLPIAFILARLLLKRKKDASSELYAAALKKENNGNYAEALVMYEMAYKEIKSSRFQTEFKEKIVGKLKVLHTIIAYQDTPIAPPPTPVVGPTPNV